MADGDLSGKTGGLRARGDGEQLDDPAFAAIMQVDIEADASLLGDAEDRTEVTIEVAIDTYGIEAAQKIGAFGDGSIEEVGRAGRAQDPALREGDDLDRDEIAETLANLQDLVEIAQPELVVDIDMAAHVQRAAGQHLAHEIGAGLRFRNSASRTDLALRLDAIGHLIARCLVGYPRQAEQGLVEMDVTVDQWRQDQRAIEIEVLG